MENKNKFDCNCNFDCIIPTPIKPGYGLIYQGGYADDWIREHLPAPVVIVNMIEKWGDHRLVDHTHVIGVITVGIDDVPTAAISDTAYICAVEAVRAYLKHGVNIYIHCAYGASRSSYLTLGVLMRETGLGVDDALARLKEARPIANPNKGFLAHLRQMEGRLRG